MVICMYTFLLFLFLKTNNYHKSYGHLPSLECLLLHVEINWEKERGDWMSFNGPTIRLRGAHNDVLWWARPTNPTERDFGGLISKSEQCDATGHHSGSNSKTSLNIYMEHFWKLLLYFNYYSCQDWLWKMLIPTFTVSILLHKRLQCWEL